MPLDTSEMDKFVGKKLFPNKDDQRNTVNVNELPGFYRVVRPGMMVTRDFHENRYNFHTDDSGTITRVSRG
ncbi:fungal protein [Schizosaccharomyces japonicus yFS275]|uniref:Fungal protein n=1 Tax=Schizosaccharomyces japonicus (strain yFS275 / FY16936) TaxID=402676 RepID=T0TB56_SCHJY|nr:fungal protein [Schizosaccharomyces japonicus yFS275]EQC53063.1 fungal protein [Schizosaccharomyces japonicus yFS275]